MLKVQTEQVIRVRDWDNLVVSTYNRPYIFQQQDGCKERQRVHISVPTEYPCEYDNETVPEKVNGRVMGVTFAAWLARDPAQKLNTTDKWDRDNGLSMWWERNFYPSVDMVANDLHAKGLLPAGDYVIDIDW